MVTEWEIRSVQTIEADGRRIIGYPIVFNAVSEDLGGFREIIEPAAVDRTLAEQIDVRALVDHSEDPTRVIGRRSAGTLRLTKDETGLRADIDVPETIIGNDILQLVKRRDVSGMSFTFSVQQGGDRFERRNGTPVRLVSDMLIRDISIVVYPAYASTDVQVAQRALRSFQQQGQRVAWLRMRHTAAL
jgi:HK97 family phage prohead protease